MLERWTGEIVGEAHIYRVPLHEIAKEAGISREMLSLYLNGKRKSPSAEPRIRMALNRILARRATEQ